MKTNDMTRQEHLEWCKKRALEYVELNQLSHAYSSMVSDLGKHPETQGHSAIELGMVLMVAGHLSTKQQMKEFIEGFN